MIAAATIRAQVSQIEQYQTAVNTFRGKYNALPGDLNNITAAAFGFTSTGRNTGRGTGDGNGVIESSQTDNGGSIYSCAGVGEVAMFWSDLSYAHLIAGSYTAASPTVAPSGVTGTTMGNYFPPAKLGNNKFVTVWSGGYSNSDKGTGGNDGNNYFSIYAINGLNSSHPCMNLQPGGLLGITPVQAYAIDSKIDDGLPQSGNVMAIYMTTGGAAWADAGMDSNTGTNDGGFSGTNNAPAPPGGGNVPVAVSCYSRTPADGDPMTYDYGVFPPWLPSNANASNCALSFRFQ